MEHFSVIQKMLFDLLNSVNHKRGLSSGYTNNELDWVVNERIMLHDIVNKIRISLDKDPNIEISEIKKAEDLALNNWTDDGYDYELILYCTELIFKDYIM